MTKYQKKHVFIMKGKSAMEHILKTLIKKRTKGIHCGIASYCTANRLVIEAIFEQAQRFDDYALIEATSNQVNQFGGYTGMLPTDFACFVYEIADEIGFNKDRIILGGDHLGPLTWTHLPEEAAMKNAIDLVKLFVLAGFKKIHLDTSMKLQDDSASAALDDTIIAERGVTLYQACEDAYQDLLLNNPCEIRPVFIIGSEVPIPGGAQENEDSIQVTHPDAFRRTIRIYQETFQKHNIPDAFENIIAVVVQPGVEFGDSDIFHYDHTAAIELCTALKDYPTLVFEGHSTDYQRAQGLHSMVADGIAILKVGPALTWALRESLFLLSLMEKELVPTDKQSHFTEVLEHIMLQFPDNWKNHYHGTSLELALSRKYSFSDRSRYYMNLPEIQHTISKLFANMDSIEIPLNMLHQYMPNQYVKVRDGHLPCQPRALVKDGIITLIEDYNYAVKHNYLISSIFTK